MAFPDELVFFDEYVWQGNIPADDLGRRCSNGLCSGIVKGHVAANECKYNF